MNLRLVATLLAALSCCAADGGLPPPRVPFHAAAEPAALAPERGAPRAPDTGAAGRAASRYGQLRWLSSAAFSRSP
jgi:hypothetical protein